MQAGSLIDAREEEEESASHRWSLLLVIGSFELVILLGALVPATLISLAPVTPYFSAPDWVNRWALFSAQATVIALPVALALHAVIQMVLRTRSLHWSLQAGLYAVIGAGLGLLIALVGAILGEDYASVALFAVPVAVFVGALGRATLALLSKKPRIGALIAAFSVASAIVVVAAVQPWR